MPMDLEWGDGPRRVGLQRLTIVLYEEPPGRRFQSAVAKRTVNESSRL